MPEKTKKTQSEIVYTRLNELIGGGSSLADAVRKVAKETGKNENSVRALRHNYMRKLEGGGRKRSRSGGPLSAEQAVAEAKKLLRGAIKAVDHELAAAKAELESAQSKYDKLASSIGQRKDELERKIRALG